MFGQIRNTDDGCDGHGLHRAKTLHSRSVYGIPVPSRSNLLSIAPEPDERRLSEFVFRNYGVNTIIMSAYALMLPKSHDGGGSDCGDIAAGGHATGKGKGADSESEVKTGDGTYGVIFPAGGIQEMVSNSPLQYCSDKAERHRLSAVATPARAQASCRPRRRNGDLRSRNQQPHRFCRR